MCVRKVANKAVKVAGREYLNSLQRLKAVTGYGNPQLPRAHHLPLMNNPKFQVIFLSEVIAPSDVMSPSSPNGWIL